MPAIVDRKDFLKGCLWALGGLLAGLGRLAGSAPVSAKTPLQPEPPKHSVKRHG
ncbi:MAG: hypothetical protein NTY77_06715 [Elusimicrobia bacterium]|nr:hypothetical protein [Elusimicrobiota bacterium]